MRYTDKCVSPRSRLASPGRHLRQVQMSINPATKQRPVNRADMGAPTSQPYRRDSLLATRVPSALCAIPLARAMSPNTTGDGSQSIVLHQM